MDATVPAIVLAAVAGLSVWVLIVGFLDESYMAVPWRVDQEGVTLCYRRKSPVTFYWKDLKDWGVTYKYIKYQKAYFLFFSIAKLECIDNGAAKRLPYGFKTTIYMGLTLNELAELRNAGILAYCRTYLDGDEDRYVPMFRSPCSLNRTNEE